MLIIICLPFFLTHSTMPALTVSIPPTSFAYTGPSSNDLLAVAPRYAKPPGYQFLPYTYCYAGPDGMMNISDPQLRSLEDAFSKDPFYPRRPEYLNRLVCRLGLPAEVVRAWFKKRHEFELDFSERVARILVEEEESAAAAAPPTTMVTTGSMANSMGDDNNNVGAMGRGGDNAAADIAITTTLFSSFEYL